MNNEVSKLITSRVFTPRHEYCDTRRAIMKLYRAALTPTKRTNILYTVAKLYSHSAINSAARFMCPLLVAMYRWCHLHPHPRQRGVYVAWRRNVTLVRACTRPLPP